MRVVNDREEKTETSELGILQVFSYALFCAAGISTVVFAPVPMILAHLRLPDNQAKMSALFGAVIALTFLEIPLNIVVLAFVFGLFIGDSAAREKGFWPTVAAVLGLATVTGFGMLLAQSVGEKASLLPYWRELVHAAVDQLQKSVQSPDALKWDQLEALLLYEGPFLYLAAALLSFWLSIGLVAHFGWFPEKHPLSGARLRATRMPRWTVFAFFALTLATAAGPEWSQRLASGFVRLVGTLLFIQGCQCLSQILAYRQVRPRVRTTVYSLSVVFGFYMLVAVGMIGPWITRKQQRATDAILSAT